MRGGSRGRLMWPRVARRRMMIPTYIAVSLMVGAALPVSCAFPLPAASVGHEAQKHEARKASGLVSDVQAEQLTLQSKDGSTLVLTTFEDYRDRVAIGAEVTALYYPQDNGNPVLKSLDYPAEMLFAPAGEIASHVHRIVLLPDSQVADADALYDAVRDYVHATLGWYVAPSYLEAEVRRRAQQSGSMLSAIDPHTGNFDMAGYLGKSQSVIASVASQTRSDGVLELNVIQVEAPVNRLEASWDGVEEPVAGAAARTLAKLSMFSRRGELPAATVELKLWDAAGNLLWRNRRGLALLEIMNGKGTHLEDRPLPVALADAPRIQHWMDAAFKSIAPKAPLAPSP